jgi:hypothetical protein
MTVVNQPITVCDGCAAREGQAVRPMTEFFVEGGESLGHLCASCFLMTQNILSESNGQIRAIFFMLLGDRVKDTLFPSEKIKTLKRRGSP